MTSNILRDLRGVDVRTVPALRPFRRKWSKELASASPQEVLQVARDILASDEVEFRFIAYELVHFHKPEILSRHPDLSTLTVTSSHRACYAK